MNQTEKKSIRKLEHYKIMGTEKCFIKQIYFYYPTFFIYYTGYIAISNLNKHTSK